MTFTAVYEDWLQRQFEAIPAARAASKVVVVGSNLNPALVRQLRECKGLGMSIAIVEDRTPITPGREILEILTAKERMPPRFVNLSTTRPKFAHGWQADH